jgi:assimilatory nitrate reductase catalytic subunit
MHYSEVNQLTHPGFDPHSRQPSYKHCAVSLRAALGRAGR